MMRHLLLAAALLCAVPASAFADDVAVIVGFHGDADPAIFGKHGGNATTALGGIRAHAGHVPAGKVKALRAEPGVAYVEEDVVRHAIGAGVDPLYTVYQADDLALIKVPEAWGTSTGAGVRVAVLDTGCQTNHPDISGKVTAVRNFTVGKSNDVTDKHGHGTHTAGTVGANTNNGQGVAGVGYLCELAIGKVLGNNGSGYSSWSIKGINWVAGKPDSGSKRLPIVARVISMSLGSSSWSASEEAAVNDAVGAGVLVVAAAGNNGNSSPSYPAAYAQALSVAAVDAKGLMPDWSNYGNTVDIAAPGVDIASTYKGNAYVLMSGTSMATPHVAGVAALVLAVKPNLTVQDLRDHLGSGTLIFATDPDKGSIKIVNAAAAVNAVAP